MVYSDKNSLVDHACGELVEKMQSDLERLYSDIAVQASSKSPDTIVSYLNMLEKSKVSAYINELLKKMRTAFSQALKQVRDEKGERRYTDSQVTLVWQSVAVETELPELAYMDIRTVQMESVNEKVAVEQNSSIPILPIVGLGLGAAGWFAVGGVSSAALVWSIRGVSVVIVGASIYGIYKKMSGTVQVHETERYVDSHVITKIMDAQYAVNEEILRSWIFSVGKRVKEGEPIL